MQKIILTDIDETLLHWRSEMENYINNVIKFKEEPWDIANYALDEWLGVSKERTKGFIDLFNTSRFFKDLKPYKNAVEGVNILSKAGWKFIGISACSDIPEVVEARRQNIKNVFGDIFLDMHCVSTFGSKAELLSSYDKTYWVEDSTQWAKAGADIGHTVFLIDLPHNKKFNDDRITRVKDWIEISKIILDN